MWHELLQLDRQLLLALNGPGGPFWDTFFYLLSGRVIWIPLYAGILYFAWRRVGTRNVLWMLLCLGIAVIAADQLCNFFKQFTPKLRPTHTPEIAAWVHTVRGYRGGLYGTVSAHAAVSFTLAFFTARLFHNRLYSCAIFLWALLVVYSRIYLGVHFPMDILFGALLGLLMGWGAFRAYLYLINRR